MADRTGERAREVGQTLEQRRMQALASGELTAAEQNLPNAGNPLRWLQALPLRERGIMRSLAEPVVPQTLGSRAREIGRLEAQLQQNPGNVEARRALDSMLNRSSSASRAVGSNTAEGLSANVTARMMVDGVEPSTEAEPRTSKSLTEDDLRRAMQSSAVDLGRYADQVQEALENGSVGALMRNLDSDPQWRRISSQIKEMTQ